ncbi:MAG: hypothetical protein AVDCRST_MAG31-227 [uncultured Sphingomonas sp.]|uniref:Uncharacterized protein n=1 Tax=uncultured Sphingomonas sp. TaxID=158754 RepID=A0A6J4SNR3_9SPHN|nr:MAG: hypothetical protein AVDCRST_MAG31-227 [uncultured Sphingomonas sp.]
MTRDSGSGDQGTRSPSSSCSAMARPKATVLPDPVLADTIRSRPCASSLITADWTDVRLSKPREVSAPARAPLMFGCCMMLAPTRQQYGVVARDEPAALQRTR